MTYQEKLIATVDRIIAHNSETKISDVDIEMHYHPENFLPSYDFVEPPTN